MKKLRSVFANQKARSDNIYFYENTQPTWMTRNYGKFADEAYSKNVIAHRAINMIAQNAASVPLQLFRNTPKGRMAIENHPILDLLKSPNPLCNGKDMIMSVFSYLQIDGNAYVLAVCPNDKPAELYVLRPDRVRIIHGDDLVPLGYSYKIGNQEIKYPVDPVTGKSQILHIKNFHPMSDWYGLSPIEAAAYSIDQHNNAGYWNQSLLQNSARPSGALVVKGQSLSEDQYSRLKSQVEEKFSGTRNTGKPMVLEGGMEWQDMSLSPKDMDFIEAKNNSAREIALAFGVPPQLLGIQGDSTYNNLAEARMALWEQTIIPNLERFTEKLSNWLTTFFDPALEISYNIDKISALSKRNDDIYSRIQNVNFMTINEKRAAVGLSPIEGGEKL